MFFSLKTLSSAALRQCCKEFAKIYYEDVNEAELKMECLHLKEYLEHVDSENEETDNILGMIYNISSFEIK